MTDAQSAVEQLFFDELAGGIEGAVVYQDVPQDAPAPLVVLGDMKSEPIGGKGDPDRRIAASVVTIVDAEERAPLLGLQRQIEHLLGDKQFQRPGWLIEVQFAGAEAGLDEDGASYVGTSQFEVLALSDD